MEGRIPENQKSGISTEPLALTIPQAVKCSGLSRSFLYRKFASGEVPRLKAGKRVLILRADLIQYLQTIRQAGGVEPPP